jgi:flagellar protein FlaH
MLLIIALIASALVLSVAAATYTLTIAPSTPISLGKPVTFTLTVTNAPGGPYTVNFSVRKPSGLGVATVTMSIDTSNNDQRTVAINYPTPAWTAVSGTVATDVGGVYNVVVNQTGPTNTGTVATGQFTVTSQWTVAISQPGLGSVFQRGQTITISATVTSPGGPVGGAVVTANTPSSGQVTLPQVNLANGAYSINYQVSLKDDPLGLWTITAIAQDSGGNKGYSSPVSVTIVKNPLSVDALFTYNSKGAPVSQFSPGETIFPYFQIRYSGSSPIFLEQGQYRVAIKNPSGTTEANLTAVYDSYRRGFYASTGYTVSSYDTGGTWSVVVIANSIDDGFGNTGPEFATSVRVDVVTSPLGLWPFIIGGIVAVLGGLVMIRRYGTSLQGFEHLEELMGGPFPRGSSLLLMGDPGAGKTVLCYQILHDELEARRPSALLSYDAFPEDVQVRMGEFGWDIVSHLRKGRLKIIDCYSGLAGQGEGALRDPSDLTELNIQVTSFITKARNAPVTLVLDSLTPIFNGVDAKQAINFLQTVGAKVKKTGGLFILTASKGAIPDDSIAKIKSTVDGVIELSVVRSGRKATRYLSILKMERRKIAPGMIQFEIDRGRGIVFRASRFGILKRKIGLLKFPTGGSSSTGENRGVVSEKTEARRVESPEPEGKGSEARGRGVGRRQR